MLTGTANINALASHAPNLRSLDGEPVALRDVDVLYAVYEIGHEGREALLPPALHPTEPPHATFTFIRAADTEFGPVEMALLRIGCRSGSRPRGFVLGCFVDNAEAGRALRDRFGFPAMPAEVRLRPSYSGGFASVSVDGRLVLHMVVGTPFAISGSDVQYTNTMTLANTPVGLRLVQVDVEYTVYHAERCVPRLDSFDAAAWGSPLVRPVYPVSASVARADLTFPRLRFVCRPDVPAFEGTEPVNRPQPA
jgi:hypothetical protein